MIDLLYSGFSRKLIFPVSVPRDPLSVYLFDGCARQVRARSLCSREYFPQSMDLINKSPSNLAFLRPKLFILCL